MSTVGEVLAGVKQAVVIESDCAELLPMLPPRSVDHVITDPPFSAYVHGLQRRTLAATSAGSLQRRAADGRLKGTPVAHDLGFSHLTTELRRLCGVHFARTARRWIVIKSDMEGVTGDCGPGWKSDLQRAGARWARFAVWWKEGAQPQLSGDRPGQGTEGFAIAHSRIQRMRWNAGGKHGRWMHRIAQEHVTGETRVHTTQTPLPLWLEIVEDFTDPSDLILDPFCGSGSLGVACVRLGRRYIGIDNGKDAQGKPWAQWAREGVEAEERGLSRSAARAGQLGLFAGVAT